MFISASNKVKEMSDAYRMYLIMCLVSNKKSKEGISREVAFKFTCMQKEYKHIRNTWAGKEKDL